MTILADKLTLNKDQLKYMPMRTKQRRAIDAFSDRQPVISIQEKTGNLLSPYTMRSGLQIQVLKI